MQEITATVSMQWTRRARIALAGFRLAAAMGLPFDPRFVAAAIVGMLKLEVRLA